MMTKNVVQMLLSVALPLAFAVGCANTRPQGAGLYGPSTGGELTSTSTDPVSRVYPDDTRPEGIIGRTAAPNGASAEDWALGENIRGALSTERRLAPYPSQISVTVDKDTKGSVILRGVMPTDYERKQLHEKVAKVPGVLQIDDQIVVGSPVNPERVDPRQPVL